VSLKLCFDQSINKMTLNNLQTMYMSITIDFFLIMECSSKEIYTCHGDIVKT
jgi:hypothetical protein